MAQTEMDKMQLMLFRQMLAQQKSPTIQVPAVQDIGSGISMGVGNIINAIMQNKANNQQQAYMDSMLAQEQQAAQLKAQTDASAAAQLGLSPELFATLDAAGKNKAYEALQKQQETMGRAYDMQDTYQQATGGGINFGPSGTDLSQATAIDPRILQAAQLGATNPLSTALAQQAVDPLLQNLNVNTPQGMNAYHRYTGQTPENTYSVGQQANQAYSGALKNLVDTQYGMPMAQAGLTGANLANQNTAANIVGQNIHNAYAPALNQAGLNSANLGNTIRGTEFGQRQQGIGMGLQALQDGTFGTPNVQASVNLLNGGQNPGAVYSNAATDMYGANKNSKKINYPAPKAAPQVAPKASPIQKGAAAKQQPVMMAKAGFTGQAPMTLGQVLYTDDPTGLKGMFGMAADHLWNAPGTRFYRGLGQ